MRHKTTPTPVKRLKVTAIRLTFLFYALSGFVSAGQPAPQEVEVATVGTQGKLKTREFVGIINIGGLIDINAPTSGIVTQFKGKLGVSVRASERLAAIKNLDELYKDVVIKSPADNIRIMRTYVEEGNFVQKHQRLMVLAKDIYYEARVHLVASEVDWLRHAKNIQVLVHPDSPHEQSFGIVDSRLEIPDEESRFYSARLKLNCPQTLCKDTTLAGAIVKVVIKNPGNIRISKEALLNNGKTVAVVNSMGVIELRKIVIGRITGELVEVLHGLALNERLVVRHNSPLSEGENVLVKSAIVERFTAIESAGSSEKMP